MDYNEDIFTHMKVLEKISTDEYLKVINDIKNIMIDTIKAKKRFYVCGNGGSCATSAHLVGEIVGKFMTKRDGYPAVDLCSNNTVITAIGNDFGYNEIFSRQLKALAQEKDTLIAFSTSGNSENILQAIKTAEEIGVNVIILSGNDGGKMKHIKNNFIVPSNSTPIIQVVHDILMHQLAGVVDEFV